MPLALPPSCDPRLKRFAEYLSRKAAPGKLPGRQHIDPLEIPDLLCHLVIHDIVPQANGNRRYRIRLAGTKVVELFGSDGTRQFLDERLPSPKGTLILGHFDRVVETKQPHYFEGKLSRGEREHILIQRICFPLARNGEDVDMLVLVVVGFDVHEKAPPAPEPSAADEKRRRFSWLRERSL